MWAYEYEIDKRTKEKTRKIVWRDFMPKDEFNQKINTPSDSLKLPGIETEIKDSSISAEGNNLPHEENKGKHREAKRKKREKK